MSDLLAARMRCMAHRSVERMPKVLHLLLLCGGPLITEDEAADRYERMMGLDVSLEERARRAREHVGPVPVHQVKLPV